MAADIALLVPCHQAARDLPALIAAARAQTEPFTEILAYDDGSRDDIVEVARALDVPLLRGDGPRGPAYARNRLAEATRCEWIHFHDADDTLSPEFVARLSPHLRANVDVAVCQTDWREASSGRLEIAWRYAQTDLDADAVDALLERPLGVISTVIRRDRFEGVGGFDERLWNWEDADLQVRLAAAGARYSVCPDVLSTSWRHARGVSADSERRHRSRLEMLERHVDTLGAARHPALGREAERLAADLLAQRLHPHLVDRALALCRRVNHAVPSSRSAPLRALRSVLPARFLLGLRERYRRFRSPSS